MCIASVAIHMMIELGTNPAMAVTPFFQYAFCTSNIKDVFLLAGPEDEQALIINSLEGAHVRYKCNCGCILFLFSFIVNWFFFFFLIQLRRVLRRQYVLLCYYNEFETNKPSDCGKTNQTSTCPNCKSLIGGENHAVQPGHVKLDDAPVKSTRPQCHPGLKEESDSLPSTHSVR